MKQFSKALASILLLLLTACGQSDPASIEEYPVAAATAIATATVNVPTATAMLPTETSVAPTATTIVPTEVPTNTPTPESVASNCLICHSDRQALVELAAPIEEPEESLSSGVG